MLLLPGKQNRPTAGNIPQVRQINGGNLLHGLMLILMICHYSVAFLLFDSVLLIDKLNSIKRHDK